MTKEEANNLQIGDIVEGYPFAGVWHTVEVWETATDFITNKRIIWLRIISEGRTKGLVTKIPADSNVFKNAYKVEKKVSLFSKVKNKIVKLLRF